MLYLKLPSIGVSILDAILDIQAKSNLVLYNCVYALKLYIF